MAKKRKLASDVRAKTPLSTYVYTDLKYRLDALHEKTKIPIWFLICEAVEDLCNKYRRKESKR